MEPSIRAATAADVPALHRLRNAVRENRLSDPARVSEASYRPYVDAGTAWVAEADGRIMGFAILDAPARSVWALFVDAEAEGAGIGRTLHQHMIDWAQRNGIKRLSLSTSGCTRAARFYTAAGWVERGRTADGELLFDKHLGA